MKQMAFIFFLSFSIQFANAQIEVSLPVNDKERTGWNYLHNQQPEWYASNEAIRIADNILLFQRFSGGWPKNIDMTRTFSAKEIKMIVADQKKKDATIDNSSTYTHLRYLALVVTATHSPKYREAFLNGFNYLLEAQYPNGGWPQYFPLRKGYYTHITFNDDAMIGVLYLMKDIADQKPEFKFLADDQIKQAKAALLKGIDIILKTQITVEGKLTAWCAQHDEVTLAPAPARSYELASISGKESIAILEFLMSIENPSNEIQQAIHSACRWYEESKIVGFRLEYVKDSTAAKGYNRLLIEDPKGPDLWARFYSLKTGQPLWVDRNGIIRETHNDISAERRNNYSYVESYAHQLLTRDYPAWKGENR